MKSNAPFFGPRIPLFGLSTQVTGRYYTAIIFPLAPGKNKSQGLVNVLVSSAPFCVWISDYVTAFETTFGYMGGHGSSTTMAKA